MNLKVILLMLLAGFAAQLNAAALHLTDYETSTVNVGDVYDSIYLEDYSEVTVLGGSVDGIWIIDNSQLYISGGNISGSAQLNDNSTLYLSGTNFYIGDTAIEYGELDLWSLSEQGLISYSQSEFDEWDGIITGILDDGSTIELSFHIGLFRTGSEPETANIVLVPEPISLALLGVGGLVTIRKR